MGSIKEITVFTVGDANDLKTWSNVPFFFSKNIEQKGIKVNRVNIEENKLFNLLYKYTIFALLKIAYRNSNHTFFRTKLNYILTQKKIKKSLKEYKHTDAAIFLTFSFAPPQGFTKKTLLFGDWTYLYYISHFLNRKPLWFEKGALNREKNNIESANTVLGLFPLSSTFIRQHYNNPSVHYLGNVINTNAQLNKEECIEQKLKSKKLLFIGNKKYITGALELIEQFKILKLKYTDLELHIIGINQNDTGITQNGIVYHGYLNKSNTSENHLYYKLLTEARVIINSTKDWGGFSATTEAMYFYTPVITTRYNEFIETYGSNIDFGYFIDNQNNLNLCIEAVLSINSDDQLKLMNAAHTIVKDFTWDNYINKMLELL